MFLKFIGLFFNTNDAAKALMAKKAVLKREKPSHRSSMDITTIAYLTEFVKKSFGRRQNHQHLAAADGVDGMMRAISVLVHPLLSRELD